MAKDSDPPPTETVTHDSGNHDGIPSLRFIHYNDVYHVEPGSKEPVGGIARFKTLCAYYQRDASFSDQPEAITVFSGDAFNPSLESSITKGKHMVPALNSVGTSVACLGNHDLDFGVEQFKHLAEQCRFPWLCANVLDSALGDEVPIANCKRTYMLTASNGIKVGIIGIVEREWLEVVNDLPTTLTYISATKAVKELAPKLRAEGAEMVMVVSHQREPNDDKLAKNLASSDGLVDIIMGGHDHFYAHKKIGDIHVLRSGADFKQLSYIEARRKIDGSKGWDFNITRRDVVSSIAEEPEAAEMVNKITEALKAKLDKPMGYTAAPLDARFTTVRLKESNMGNFVCDVMRNYYAADCAIMAAGTIRGDQIYLPGLLKLKDLMNCFPFEDPCVVIGIKGRYVLEALENAVGKYPALEGRFPQVSGIKFTFDASREPGSRCYDVFVGDQPLEPEKEYKVVTRDYMVRGKDGFTSLQLNEDGGTARSIVSEENGELLSGLMRKYFMSLKVLGKFKNWSHSFGPPNVPAAQQPTDVSDESRNGTEVPGSKANARQDASSRAVKAQHRQSGPPAKRFKADNDYAAYVDDSDSDDDESSSPLATTVPTPDERVLRIMRKYLRRWWKLAGLPGHPNLSEQRGDDSGVPWAKGIAPQLEGRITIINGETTSPVE